jgi:Flp pilus assembly protein TadD
LFCNREEARIKLGEYSAALADLNQAINLSPKLGEAYYYRGVANEHIGNSSVAQADKTKAAEFGFKEGEDSYSEDNKVRRE